MWREKNNKKHKANMEKVTKQWTKNNKDNRTDKMNTPLLSPTDNNLYRHKNHIEDKNQIFTK